MPRKPSKASASSPGVIVAGGPLESHLNAGAQSALYVVTSERIQPQRGAPQDPPLADPWSLNKVVHQIEEAALRDGNPQMDLAQIDYIDGDSKGEGVHQLIVSETRSMSLLGGVRVVSVSNAEGLAWSDSGKTPDPLAELVEKVKPGGRPPFVLILCAAKVDRRRKAWKQVLDKAVEVAVPAMTPTRLDAYLREQAAGFGIQLAPRVAQAVWDRLGGGDPARLRQMADQLLLDAGPRGEITLRHVDEVVPVDREAVIFKLTDQLGAGRVREAFAVLQLLLKQGDDPLRICGFLASHYRALLRVKEEMARGLGPQEIAEVTKMHPYRTQLLCQAAHHAVAEELELALHNTFVYGERMKASRLGVAGQPQRRWLEQLLMSLARSRPMALATRIRAVDTV